MNVVSPLVYAPAPTPYAALAGRQSYEVGIADYLAILARRTPQIAMTFLVVALAVMAYMMTRPQQFTATATLIINPAADAGAGASRPDASAAPDASVIESEVEVLQSRQVIEMLVPQLSLDSQPEWNPALRPPGPVAIALEWVKRQLPASVAGPAIPGEIDAIVVEEVERATDVSRRGLSNVIDVSVTSQDAAASAKIANAVVASYLKFNLQQRGADSERTSEWLTQRLDDLQRNVVSAEQAAQAFRASSGLMTSGGMSQAERQVSDLQTATMNASADVVEKQARYAQVVSLVQAGGSAESIAGALNSDVIRDLRERESDLMRKQAELEARYGELYPAVETGRVELDNTREQIKLEIRRIENNLRNELEISQARLQTLESRYNRVQAAFRQTNFDMVRLKELERDASVARTVYEEFLGRSHEVSKQGDLLNSGVRIIADAKPPTKPSSPNLLLAVLLSLAAGTTLGLLVAVVMEWMDHSLHCADDVERKVGVPVIASIPAIGRKQLRLLAKSDRHPAGYAVDKPLSHYAEAIRVIRNAITYADRTASSSVVAITSALPADGKTTTALSLARITALAGQRVLLVDCDLRRRSLNSVLGIAPARGLLQVLSGELPWREAIGKDELSGAHVLVAAENAATPRDVFGTDAMQRLLAELRSAYDLVILDCPPVLALAESRVLSALADGTIIVARADSTHALAVSTILDQIEATGAKVIGVVLNCVDMRLAGRVSYKEALYYRQAEKAYYVA